MTTLPAGTTLSRVHLARYPSEGFNPVEADLLYAGGRFDSTSVDPYGFLYAALTDGGAIAETLLRDIPANDRGGRFLSRVRWHERQLSRVTTTGDLTLITLQTGADLGAIGQDTWLTMCDGDDYPQTRDWAHWLRGLVPTAQGIIWLSKREPGVPVLILFEDRCPADVLTPAPGPLPAPCLFANPAGADWLKAQLAPYRVSIRR
jgi:hypothetical protein